MLNPGSVFAGYGIESTLGGGAMGEVYLARHPRLPRSDALKLLSEGLSRSDSYRRRFTAEADLACLLQHESVVRVYDRGEDGNRLWLAMEYVEGQDLAQILAAEGRLTTERAVALLERIAAGLDAIHAHGLLHGDVKPSNVLVTQDVQGTERAMLTDFGIAKEAADSLGLTGVGHIVATLHYAAPEQFELRSKELDPRVDVYALGCVFYEMLTGRVPLDSDSVAAYWTLMQSETPPPPSRFVPGLSPELDAVLAKALSKPREARYESAGELARAARVALVPVEVPAPGSGPFRPANLAAASKAASKPARKRTKRWLIAGAAAVIIAAAVIAAVLLVFGGKAVPGVPGSVSAAAGRGTVKVSWKASSGKVDHYVVDRDGKPVGAFVTGTSFTDPVADLKRHSYTVEAVNAKGTRSAPSAAVVAVAQIRELNAAEKALLAKLPTSLADAASCKPLPDEVNANLNLAITCAPKPGQVATAPGKVPQAVNVYGAAGAAQLKAALSAEAAAHGAKPGNCSSVPQRGTWNFTETPKVINGEIICYRTTRSTLLWSYDSKLFYVKISTTASYLSLENYWEDAALHLP